MQSEEMKPPVKQEADQPRWERVFWNSYGGYEGYRFQDFRSGCELRNSERNCTHEENPSGGQVGDGDSGLCLCDYCPLVEIDIEEGDDTDYSEGEQPILVIEHPLAEAT